MKKQRKGRPRPEYTREQRDRAVFLYRQGVLLSEISKEVGAHPTTISTWAQKAGEPRRRSVISKYPASVRTRAIKFYQAGFSGRQAAQLAGVKDGTTIRDWLREEGIPRRTISDYEWTTIPHKELDLMVRLYDEGYSQHEIADMLNLHQTSVSKRFLRLGLRTRTTSEALRNAWATGRKKAA